MELDDLKQTWKQSNSIQTSKNKNIMEMIQQKSTGPIAELKHSFRQQIVLVIVMATAIILTNLPHAHAMLTSVMFWCYMAFCVGLCSFLCYNYVLVTRMSGMASMVKATLEHHINILDKRLRWHFNGVRVVFLFFIVLAEVLPYFQHSTMLDKWHSLSPLIRFGAYAALLTFQYFKSRAFLHRRVGRHIDYLRQLVKEME